MQNTPTCRRSWINRFFLAILALSLFSTIVFAADLDSTMARQYATAFFRQIEWIETGAEPEIRLVFAPTFSDTINDYSDIAYYVFELEQKGYVGISAWNTTRTLLFYAEGGFEINRQVPAFQYWLTYYTELALQNYLHKAPDTKSDIITSKAGDISYATTPEYVNPLLTSAWNQGCYFNELCPPDAEGPCGHVWAGCVATAIAQIMNYYEYPAVGTGTHSYTHEIYGVQSADFSIGYNYSLYPDVVTEPNLEVARFLYHIGVAVEMDYSPTGSGANFETEAMINFFNYDDEVIYLPRSDYEDEDWQEMLRIEVSNNRPVYYRGSNGTTGHAFVCDGYDAFGLFHINLGWGGNSNGYYALDDLSYNQNQGAVFYFSPPYTGPMNENDSLALVALYNETGGSSWTNSDNWLTGPVDTWYGVATYNGRVTAIDLSANNLIDSLPEELWSLEFLAELYLSDNSLSGTLSDSISKLIALEYIDLNSNTFTGSLPAGLGNLSLLREMNLGSNAFSGQLPDSLGSLKYLELLNLSYNALSGEIPGSIGKLKSLINLNLMYNNLEGPIPDSLYSATNLGALYLNNNQLTGSISSAIDSLANLQYLYLDNNILTGDLPAELFGHTRIRYLLLDHNNFSGTIPDEIGDLNLYSLNLSFNQFSGPMPSTLINCTNLYYIHVGANAFTYFPDLSGLSSLDYLYMYRNRFNFEDIEPNLGVTNMLYYDQANVGDTTQRIVGEGSPDTLFVSCRGANNLYQWYKDGVMIAGATESSYIIESVQPGDAGVYRCIVSNSLVSDLDITSNPITLKVMPAGWSYDPGDFTLSGSIIARVSIAGEDHTTGYLACFLDTVCTGLVKSQYSSTADRDLFILECHGLQPSTDSLSFQYYDTIAGQTYLLNEKLEFTPGMNEGTELAPFVLNHGVVFECEMPVGWSWLSVNVQMADMSVNRVLPSNSSHGDYIKNQTKSTTYYTGYGWFGTMQELRIGDSYMSRFASIDTLTMCGIPVDPLTTPIHLNAGWNFLGYLPSGPLPVDQALSALPLTEGDYIKSQTASATYYDATGWFGELAEMKPSEGYMIRLAQAGTLYYPEYTGAKKNVSYKHLTEGLSFDYRQYSTNSSLTACVKIGDEYLVSEGDQLIAMAGEEIRGIANASYFDELDRYVFPIMVFGHDEEEKISFRFYESSNDMMHECNEIWTYEKDAILGTAREPFSLSTKSLLGEKLRSYDQGLRIYPNPVRDKLHISLELMQAAQLDISIFDLTGRKVALISSGNQPKGVLEFEWNTSDLPSGTYIIEVIAGESIMRSKILLRR